MARKMPEEKISLVSEHFIGIQTKVSMHFICTFFFKKNICYDIVRQRELADTHSVSQQMDQSLSVTSCWDS